MVVYKTDMPSKEFYKLLKTKARREQVPLRKKENEQQVRSEEENLKLISKHFGRLIGKEIETSKEKG